MVGSVSYLVPVSLTARSAIVTGCRGPKHTAPCVMSSSPLMAPLDATGPRMGMSIRAMSADSSLITSGGASCPERWPPPACRHRWLGGDAETQKPTDDRSSLLGREGSRVVHRTLTALDHRRNAARTGNPGSFHHRTSRAAEPHPHRGIEDRGRWIAANPEGQHCLGEHSFGYPLCGFDRALRWGARPRR